MAAAADVLDVPEGADPEAATDDELAARGAAEAGAVLTAPAAGAGVGKELRRGEGMLEVGG